MMRFTLVDIDIGQQSALMVGNAQRRIESTLRHEHANDAKRHGFETTILIDSDTTGRRH